jgi:hypothetical protein
MEGVQVNRGLAEEEDEDGDEEEEMPPQRPARDAQDTSGTII